jgi:hypothetical protein
MKITFENHHTLQYQTYIIIIIATKIQIDYLGFNLQKK